MLTNFCALHSAGCETQYGTAPVIHRLLLIEYPRPWGDEALDESDIPLDVRLHLQQLLDEGVFSRIMLIKRQDSRIDRIRVFAIDCREKDPFMRAAVFADYRELMEPALARLFDEPSIRQPVDPEPLYLVCTNGRKDKCCSKFGLPVYYRLGQLGVPAWQCTHVTGDRFAPNIVQMPYGHYYGRVKAAELEAFLITAESRHIYAPWYRGRCCYTQEVQAAEYFLRTRTDSFGYDDLQFLETVEGGAFLEAVAQLKERHRIRWTVEWSESDYMLNCEPKMGKIKLFKLLGISL